MRIVFSKDRAAQLDLLLRSLRKHAPHEATRVIWWASDISRLGPFFDAYTKLPVDQFLIASPYEFDLTLRRVLMECPDETVTFFCDDDVVYRDIPRYDLEVMGTMSHEVLTFSLRLAAPTGGTVWAWHHLPRTDHGFPGSIDGHTFRVDDVWEMIGDTVITDPTGLEDVLAAGCERLAAKRPLMAAFAEQKLVGVSVNRVSDRSGCAAGEWFPQSAEKLNERFLAGERIDLDALDFTGVRGCHHEIRFAWK